MFHRSSDAVFNSASPRATHEQKHTAGAARAESRPRCAAANGVEHRHRRGSEDPQQHRSYTPFGSTTYQQTGWRNVGGIDVPTYSQTTAFNPTVQSIVSGTENAAASLMPAVQTLADEAGRSVTAPLNFAGVNQDYLNAGPQLLDRDATDAVYRQQKSFLDPQWQQGQKDLEDQLSRQGISAGSDAYNSAMTNFQNQKIQAYQSAQDSATAQGAQNAGLLFNQALAGQKQNISQQQLAQMSPIELLGMLYNSGVT
jgi:hypothetical protein